MAALREKKLKAQTKVSRAEKALESAQKELQDILAAERVMLDITGESLDAKPSEISASERDIVITKLLHTSQQEAMSPAELYPIYQTFSGDTLNLETFRTAVWRLLKKTIPGEEMKAWIVKSEGGKYWREPVLDSEFDNAELDDSEAYDL